MTLEEIYILFKDFADNHLQVHSFGYGSDRDMTVPQFALNTPVNTQDLPAVQYALLYVIPISRNIENTSLLYEFEVICADRVNKDGRDRINIESDTLQIITDFIAYLRQNEAGYTLNRNINIRPFWGEYADLLIGNSAQIRLKTPYQFNDCAIPFI